MQKLRTCEHNSTYTTLSLYLDVLDGWTLLPHATSSISIVSYNIHGSFTITIPSGVCCCALCCSCQISFIKIFEVYWLVGCIYIDELTDFVWNVLKIDWNVFEKDLVENILKGKKYFKQKKPLPKLQKNCILCVCYHFSKNHTSLFSDKTIRICMFWKQEQQFSVKLFSMASR